MKKRQILLFGSIILGALAFQLYEVNEPWTGLKDFNGAIYGIVSRNFLKHGYVETRFGPAVNTGPVNDGHFTYYLHHPPLYYIFVSFSYRLFGVHEWSARIVSILFSVISLFFFFRLIRKIWGLETAYYATFFLAFLPMNLYFSRIVVQESSIMLGTILTLWYYVKWRERRRPSEYWRIAGIFVFFGMIDWPAYYILPLLTLHTLAVDRGRESRGRLRIILLPLLCVALFALFLVYCTAITKAQGGAGLWEAFLFRSAIKTPYLDYSMVDFLRAEASYAYHFFTPVVPLLALLWLCGLLRIRQDFERELYVVIIIFVGAIHVLLFKDAAFLHEFWLYQLCPGISLAAGLAIVGVIHHPEMRRHRALRIVVMYIVPFLFFLNGARETILIHGRIVLRSHAIAGERIHERSDETDRIIVHWEDPVPTAVARYFRYYGSPLYSRPVPILAYYADRNVRWGVRDADDLLDLMEVEESPFRFFVTKIGYLRKGMREDVRRVLFNHFEPIFMLDTRGDDVSPDVFASFLLGKEASMKRGIIVFERKTIEK